MAVGSLPIQRHLKMKNVSSIPVSLFWHLFISNDESDSSKHRFNLVYHMKNLNTMEFKSDGTKKEDLKLLISEFYGKEASCEIFQARLQVEATTKPL